jgi:quinohemoprotein ethanol dehydrogenase
MSGRLVAWDPVAQREVWRVEHPDPMSGGTLSTAGGLVFQGRADGRFRAYHATNGAVLWEYAQETGIGAAPVTYAVGETQYVAVLAGWGGPQVLLNTGLGKGRVGPGRLLVFALDGKATLPDPLPARPPIPAPTVDLRLTPAVGRPAAVLRSLRSLPRHRCEERRDRSRPAPCHRGGPRSDQPDRARRHPRAAGDAPVRRPAR